VGRPKFLLAWILGGGAAAVTVVIYLLVNAGSWGRAAQVATVLSLFVAILGMIFAGTKHMWHISTRPNAQPASPPGLPVSLADPRQRRRPYRSVALLAAIITTAISIWVVFTWTRHPDHHNAQPVPSGSSQSAGIGTPTSAGSAATIGRTGPNSSPNVSRAHDATEGLAVDGPPVSPTTTGMSPPAGSDYSTTVVWADLCNSSKWIELDSGSTSSPDPPPNGGAALKVSACGESISLEPFGPANAVTGPVGVSREDCASMIAAQNGGSTEALLRSPGSVCAQSPERLVVISTAGPSGYPDAEVRITGYKRT
jgi:hypothetical protein